MKEENTGVIPDSATSAIAFGTVIITVLAGISNMLSSFHLNQTISEQVLAANNWGYYQSKGIKAALLSQKIELLTALGKPASPDALEKSVTYTKEQDKISEQARENERNAAFHLKQQVTLSRSTIIFQIALGIAALSIMTRRRSFWYTSLLFSLGGILVLIQGVLTST